MSFKCNVDHRNLSEGILYKDVMNPMYCKVHYYLHGMRCAECQAFFTNEHSSGGADKVFKPLVKQPIMTCITHEKGYKHELFFLCYQKNVLQTMETGNTSRSTHRGGALFHLCHAQTVPIYQYMYDVVP